MGDTRWLDDDEQAAWRAYIGATTRVRQRCDSDLLEATGLLPDDYAILVLLSESPDRRARMSDVAEHLATSPSRLTYRVDRLVTMGYVERASCPTDKRGSFAVLTDEGMEALEAAAPIHVASVRTHLLDHLTRDELVQLGSLLAKVGASGDVPSVAPAS